MWILLVILASVVAIALMAGDLSAAVKQRGEPLPCARCGRPTWSINGLCFKCRGAAAMTPVASSEIEAPPVIRHPLAANAPREAITDLEGRIAEDIGCSSCGYNLRGLTPSSSCPECSLPIGLSIKGDLLQFCNPNWVERLARGVIFLIIGIFAGVVFSIVVTFGMVFATMAGRASIPLQLMLGVVGLAASAVFVYGVWLLTARDPARAENEKFLSARLVARWGSVSSLAHWPAQMAMTALMGTGAPNLAAGPLTAPTPALMVVMTLVTIISFVVLIAHLAGLILLRALAHRIPRQSLARQTTIVIWGYGISLAISVPSSMVAQWAMLTAMGTTDPSPLAIAVMLISSAGNCFGTLGTLTFGIWGIVLLFLYHGAFKGCAAAARQLWTQTSQAHQVAAMPSLS